MNERKTYTSTDWNLATSMTKKKIPLLEEVLRKQNYNKQKLVIKELFGTVSSENFPNKTYTKVVLEKKDVSETFFRT